MNPIRRVRRPFIMKSHLFIWKDLLALGEVRYWMRSFGRGLLIGRVCAGSW